MVPGDVASDSVFLPLKKACLDVRLGHRRTPPRQQVDKNRQNLDLKYLNRCVCGGAVWSPVDRRKASGKSQSTVRGHQGHPVEAVSQAAGTGWVRGGTGPSCVAGGLPHGGHPGQRQVLASDTQSPRDAVTKRTASPEGPSLWQPHVGPPRVSCSQSCYQGRGSPLTHGQSGGRHLARREEPRVLRMGRLGRQIQRQKAAGWRGTHRCGASPGGGRP